jgi:5'-nucleotidase
VNVPPVPEREIAGVLVTRQGKSTWDDTFDVRRDPANREYFWLTGKLNVVDNDLDVDQIAIQKGYVSVTPIHYDLTDRMMQERMRSWGLENLK